ncbi:hypothetical protein ACHAWF_012190 [Thalassiosira exigua]
MLTGDDSSMQGADDSDESIRLASLAGSKLDETEPICSSDGNKKDDKGNHCSSGRIEESLEKKQTAVLVDESERTRIKPPAAAQSVPQIDLTNFSDDSEKNESEEVIIIDDGRKSGDEPTESRDTPRPHSPMSGYSDVLSLFLSTPFSHQHQRSLRKLKDSIELNTRKRKTLHEPWQRWVSSTRNCLPIMPQREFIKRKRSKQMDVPYADEQGKKKPYQLMQGHSENSFHDRKQSVGLQLPHLQVRNQPLTPHPNQQMPPNIHCGFAQQHKSLDGYVINDHCAALASSINPPATANPPYNASQSNTQLASAGTEVKLTNMNRAEVANLPVAFGFWLNGVDTSKILAEEAAAAWVEHGNNLDEMAKKILTNNSDPANLAENIARTSPAVSSEASSSHFHPSNNATTIPNHFRGMRQQLEHRSRQHMLNPHSLLRHMARNHPLFNGIQYSLLSAPNAAEATLPVAHAQPNQLQREVHSAQTNLNSLSDSRYLDLHTMAHAQASPYNSYYSRNFTQAPIPGYGHPLFGAQRIPGTNLPTFGSGLLSGSGYLDSNSKHRVPPSKISQDNRQSPIVAIASEKITASALGIQSIAKMPVAFGFNLHDNGVSKELARIAAKTWKEQGHIYADRIGAPVDDVTKDYDIGKPKGAKGQRSTSPKPPKIPALLLSTGTVPNLSENWTSKTYQRMSGKTIGTRDTYYYSPKEGFKFRSMTSCKAFLRILNEPGVDGNESHALKLFKERGHKV